MTNSNFVPQSSFPASLASLAGGMNPSTIRSLRRDGILKLDQDIPGHHAVFSTSDLIRIAVLQRLIDFGLNLKTCGKDAATRAVSASIALRTLRSTSPWLVIMIADEESPTPTVGGPFSDQELPKVLASKRGAAFVLNVDTIWSGITEILIDVGALKVGKDGLLR